MIGCSLREWVVDRGILPRKQPASFYMSGVVVAATNSTSSSSSTSSTATTIWRFTPSIPLLNGGGGGGGVAGMAKQDGSGKYLTVGPVLFDGRHCTLQFEQGLLLPSPPPPAVDTAGVSGSDQSISPIAPYGLWILQPGNRTAQTSLACDGSSAAIPWPPAPQQSVTPTP